MKFPPDLSTAHGTPEERRAFGRATSIATRRVLNQFVVRRIRELREQREGNKVRSAEGMLPPSRKPFAVKDPHPSQQFPDPDVQYREIGTGYELLTEKQTGSAHLPRRRGAIRKNRGDSSCHYHSGPPRPRIQTCHSEVPVQRGVAVRGNADTSFRVFPVLPGPQAGVQIR
jgi:hypothetical protein